ncbi:sigma-70 family RNA polymerase sigma factor [Demequina sp.]|uniref:sigma-70 family RNA polymerase sigma factor n=1 Tax=Demequina sp. TaxID=2050685 RepID=UPI003D0B7105
MAWEPMLNELATQRSGRLLAFATMLAGPSAADDLVQEAVIATFSRGRGFASVAQAEQYVRRAIATRYIDSVRKDSARRSAEQRAALAPVMPDATAGLGADAQVDAALASLAPRVRACVVLRYMEDLSIRETAHVLGLSEGTVKRYVADGLAVLNARLGTTTPDDNSLAPVTTTEGGAR